MSSSPQENASAALSDGAPAPYVTTRGKPPREHQFKPGQSGNPGGRPRGSKNFRTLIQLQLDDTITATVKGRARKVTKREAIAMRLIDKALKGDQKAIETIMKFSEEEAETSSLPPMDTDPERDAEILAAYLARRDEGAGHA